MATYIQGRIITKCSLFGIFASILEKCWHVCGVHRCMNKNFLQNVYKYNCRLNLLCRQNFSRKTKSYGICGFLIFRSFPLNCWPVWPSRCPPTPARACLHTQITRWPRSNFVICLLQSIEWTRPSATKMANKWRRGTWIPFSNRQMPPAHTPAFNPNWGAMPLTLQTGLPPSPFPAADITPMVSIVQKSWDFFLKTLKVKKAKNLKYRMNDFLNTLFENYH